MYPMKETGTVVRIEKDKAIVSFTSRSACASCGMNTACTLTGGKARELALQTEGLTLSPGDAVEIETPARSVVIAAFLVFILPILLSFAAYLVLFSKTRSTGIGLAGFFIAFALSEAVIALLDRLVGRGRYFEPKILKKK